jgi:hypothetical protein
VAGAVAHGSAEGIVQQTQVVFASDEPTFDTTGEWAAHREDGLKSKCYDRLGLALQPQWLEPFSDNDVLDEAVGLGSHQDLARRRSLLKTGGEVWGVAGDEGMPERRITGQNITSRDTHADIYLYAMLPPQFVVQPAKRVAHLARSPECTECVILVHGGNPEDGHDGVADELLDNSTMPLEDPAHGGEVASEDASERFWIETFA